MNGLKVHQATDNEKDLWDTYVNQHSEGTFFHLFGWKQALNNFIVAVGEGFGKLKGKDLVAVLPLGHIKSLFFGNALISTPFAVYGGVLSDNNEVRDLLTRKACQLA